MSFSFSSLHVWLGAAALTLGGLLVCSAQTGGKERGWPIEFSSPKGDEGTTNLNQLMRKLEGLKPLEEGLYQLPQSFAPPSSLDGVIARPTRPPAGPLIQNKRVKELLERRKNWIFMSPEDLVAGPSTEDILKTPEYGADGQEKKEQPLFERYYRSLATKRPGAKDLMQSENEDLFGSPTKSKPRDELVTREDANLPSSLKERVETLKIQFEPGGRDNPFIQNAARGSLVDTFGLEVKPLSKEQVQEQKKFMDDYHTVLDRSWHPLAAGTPVNPLAIEADAAPPAAKPATGLPGSPSPEPHRGLEAQLDVVNPVLGPPGLPDVNAQALGQTRPTLALPKVESTRVAPVAPTFTAPSRAFR